LHFIHTTGHAQFTKLRSEKRRKSIIRPLSWSLCDKAGSVHSDMALKPFGGAQTRSPRTESAAGFVLVVAQNSWRTSSWIGAINRRQNGYCKRHETAEAAARLGADGLAWR
jgi:hypothetical protein